MEKTYNIDQAREIIELTKQEEVGQMRAFGSKAFEFLFKGEFYLVNFKELYELECNLKYSLKVEY